mmetsp:Transcript_10203/g.30678  ORF Transcript_10203/g.30678 Transcript_10203/m.30678 type:complete len:273 (-) Transcript_10203:110-928(-)
MTLRTNTPVGPWPHITAATPRRPAGMRRAGRGRRPHFQAAPYLVQLLQPRPVDRRGARSPEATHSRRSLGGASRRAGAAASSSPASSASARAHWAGRGRHAAAASHIASQTAGRRAPKAAEHVGRRGRGRAACGPRPASPLPRCLAGRPARESWWLLRCTPRPDSPPGREGSDRRPRSGHPRRPAPSRRRSQSCPPPGPLRVCRVRRSSGLGIGPSTADLRREHHLLVLDGPRADAAVTRMTKPCSQTARRRGLPAGPRGWCRFQPGTTSPG